MISVVLAVYNEENNIRRCLESVKEFADEIVVVDGSSIDQTREIAKQLGAKVIKTSNKPIFHINKQLAIDAAKHNLILQLDADEVVDKELNLFIQELNQKLQKHPSSVKEKAWWLKRKNNFLGHWLKKGGQYPDPVIRLFIRGKARLPQKSVHEQMEVEGQVGWANGHLLHYSNPHLRDYWRKLQTYTSLEATKLIEADQSMGLRKIFNYLLIKPISTFFNIFIRHKGFVDGVYGLLFAFLSASHFPIILFKFISKKS